MQWEANAKPQSSRVAEKELESCAKRTVHFLVSADNAHRTTKSSAPVRPGLSAFKIPTELPVE
jgi:hypothetical protein